MTSVNAHARPGESSGRHLKTKELQRGVYFATYRCSFIAPEAALESAAGALAA